LEIKKACVKFEKMPGRWKEGKAIQEGKMRRQNERAIREGNTR
jgi:hypothetical protein